MGLFTDRHKATTAPHNTDMNPRATEPATTPQERPHRTYPNWQEGDTAPRLFERLNGWTPGDYPPGHQDDPPQVIGDRYATHIELWRAVQRWEEQQNRLDNTATAIHRHAEREEQAAAQRKQNTLDAKAEQARLDAAHAARLERLRAAAAEHGMTITVDEYPAGVERVRLTAPRNHPAVGKLYPWETPPPQIHTAGGVIVMRAGAETITGAEQFLEDWPQILRDAQQANPRLRNGEQPGAPTGH